MYEDENNLYHYSYRKGDGSGTIDTKNYAEDPWDKNQGDKTPKKKGGMTGKIVALALVCALVGGFVGAGVSADLLADIAAQLAHSGIVILDTSLEPGVCTLTVSPEQLLPALELSHALLFC